MNVKALIYNTALLIDRTETWPASIVKRIFLRPKSAAA